MDIMNTRHGILLTRDHRRVGADDRMLRRGAERGELVRLARGAFLPRRVWDSMSLDERYRARCRATALAGRSRPVLSHYSAAAMWGMPSIDPWPARVHVLTTIATGSRSEGGVTRHAAELDELDAAVLDGIRITSPVRTLLDVARSAPFANAVAMWDFALSERAGPARVDARVLQRRTTESASARGGRRIARVQQFANGASGSPGESLSRVVISELGFPQPVLQHPFSDRRGFIGAADFWWEKYLLVGEFDGLGKYLGDRFGNDLSSDQIVVAEKRREDRLRALGNGVTRWEWADARNPRRLYEQLYDAGLRVEHRPVVFA